MLSRRTFMGASLALLASPAGAPTIGRGGPRRLLGVTGYVEPTLGRDHWLVQFEFGDGSVLPMAVRGITATFMRECFRLSGTDVTLRQIHELCRPKS